MNPWQSVPKSHQLALKSANIGSLLPKSPSMQSQNLPTQENAEIAPSAALGTTPFSATSSDSLTGTSALAAKYTQLDAQVNQTNQAKLSSGAKANFNAPSVPTNRASISEKTHPHGFKSLARSGVKVPGFSGSEGMTPTPGVANAASAGLSNIIRQNPASLGKI